MRNLPFLILLPSRFLPSRARTEMHVKPRDAMHTVKSCQEEGQLKEGRANSLKFGRIRTTANTNGRPYTQVGKPPQPNPGPGPGPSSSSDQYLNDRLHPQAEG